MKMQELLASVGLSRNASTGHVEGFDLKGFATTRKP
jgi:hypothetical protein